MARKSVATTTTNQHIAFASAAYFSDQAAFTAIIWFRTPSNAGGNAFSAIMDNSGNFPSSCSVQMNTSGQITYLYRGATATAINSTSGAFDDGVWHWLMILRRSATDHQWYIDGTSIATAATDPGTVTPNDMALLASGNNNLPAGAQIGRFMVWRRALTILEARRAAFNGMDKSGGPLGTVWCELGSPVIERDLSGNKNNGTPGSSSTIGESVPPEADYYDLAKFRRPQIKAAAVSADTLMAQACL